MRPILVQCDRTAVLLARCKGVTSSFGYRQRATVIYCENRDGVVWVHVSVRCVEKASIRVKPQLRAARIEPFLRAETILEKTRIHAENATLENGFESKTKEANITEAWSSHWDGRDHGRML